MRTQLHNILGRIINYDRDSDCFKYEALGDANMEVALGNPITYEKNDVTQSTQDIITSIDIKDVFAGSLFSPIILNKGEYIISPEIRNHY